MKGVELLTAIVLGCGFASGQFIEYLPLQPGNEWVYAVREWPSFQPERETTAVIRVREYQERDGRLYSLVEGFSNRLELLRLEDSGDLVRWDETSQRPETILRFAARMGEEAGSSARGCLSGAPKVVAESRSISTPVGDFENAWSIEYFGFGPCPAGGVESESYVPYVGMVTRSTRWTGGGGGFRSLSLVYSRTGGVTQFSEAAEGLALHGRWDAGAPGASPQAVSRIRGRVSIRRRVSGAQERLHMEVKLRTVDGETVWSTSATVTWPGLPGLREIQIPFVLATAAGEVGLETGSYRLTATVTGERGFRASGEVSLAVPDASGS